MSTAHTPTDPTSTPRAEPAVRKPLARRALTASAMFLCASAIATTLANPAMAATRPISPLSLGKPVVTASCKGGSYHLATPGSPMTTISGQKWTSGIALIGTNCNTAFTWQLKGGYSTLEARVELDAAGSGPLQVEFRSGNAPVKFKVDGRMLSELTVGSQGPVPIDVPVAGVHDLSIVLPNSGSDAGILDVTSGNPV